jgi:hypothetical protein
MKRKAIPTHVVAEVMARDGRACRTCGINVVALDIWLRGLPSSWDRVYGPAQPELTVYGKRDRFTQTTNQGALLGRHRDRAMTLLGRLWGTAIYPGRQLHEIDHIQPVAEGGSNEPSNLRVLCLKCHRGESAALNNRLRKRPSKGVGRGFR